MAKKTEPKEGRQRLDPKDWLAAAFELLTEKGAAAVRVEPLAARLGVTKGSFYWHFRDLSALHEAMREAWVVRSTEWFIQKVEACGGAPKERLRNLFALVAAAPKATSRAVYAWGALDAATAARIATIDERRASFVRGLLIASGLPPEEAALRAAIVTNYVVGEIMNGGETSQERAMRVADFILMEPSAGPR
jgi:AcrR family transcriptional regulator